MAPRQSEIVTRLARAEESLRLVKARDDAISNFLQTIREYRCQKDEAKRHSLLLRWIKQQIAQLERRERSGSPPITNGEDEKTKPRGFRLESHNHELTSLGSTTLLPPQRRENSKRSRSDMLDDERLLKRTKNYNLEGVAGTSNPGAAALATRRSARIAEKTKKAAKSGHSGVEAPVSYQERL